MIVCFNKHSRGNSIYKYGTPGIGETFIGSKDKEGSDLGNMVIEMFKTFAKGYVRDHCLYVFLFAVSSLPGGRGCTPLYLQQGDVPPNTVWFLPSHLECIE